MREVIKELEETTEYRFFYNDGIKGLNSPISVDVEDADINAVMDAIAKQANVAYVLKSGHQIVLSSVKTVQQQGNKKVTGTITDPKGEPIIGANVVVKGSTNGTITDIDGHFSIEVTPNAILQVSYIGYVAQDVPVGNKDNLVISIHEDTQKLDEVVVVGYGSQKKVNLTGAVEQVTSDVFEGRPTANATQMLEGVVPNLNISLSDGKPGRTADFNVRGAGSINGGSASLQSPQNVPDVVSDGYIWAKHFYDAYFNYNQANPSGINKTQQFSVAWLDEYKRRHETGDFGTVISDGSIGTKGRYVYYPEGTDYYDLMYKKSVFAQNQNLSISGSDGKFDYYLSGRFYSYDGLFDSDEQTDKFKTYNMRFKGGYQLTPWLKINNNFEFSHNKYYNPITYSEGSGVVWRNIADEGHPSSPLFNPDGTMTYSAVYTVGDLLYGRSGITTKNSNLKNTTTFNAKFLGDRLRVNGDFTYQQKTQEKTKKQVRSPYARSADANGESKIEYITGTYSNLAETTDHTNYLATNLFAEFEETFAEKHYFKAMAGWNYEKSSFKRIYAYNDDLLTDDVDNMNLVMGTDNRSITSQWKAYQFGGAFFRLNYAFDDRYLLEVNGRYDGSSRFPSDERWAFFPSASVGWRISQEPWWNVKSEHISNAKVRFSWGSLGNAAGLSNYQYIQTLGISKSDYILDGLRQNYMSSPAALPGNLTWETATTYDIGVDLGFFDNRLTVSGDYYIRKTTDMIVNGPTVPDVFGASSPKGNYADMSTYGYELSLEWKDGFDLAGKRFNYSIKGTLADYYSVIDKFNNANMSLSEYANQSLDKNYYEGMRIGEIWGFVSNGLWQDQAGIDAAEAAAKAAGQSYYNPLMQTSKTYKLYPGDIKFEDLNGNGYIDRGQNTVDDPGDRKIIGNEEPRYIYSFTLSADWNNIWVSAFFQGVGKQDWYPSNEASTFWGQYNRPYNQMPSWHVDNYWTPENPDAFLPRYTGYYAPFYGGHKNANTRYLMNAAYLRLKNIQVGYNLPSEWIKKLHLTNVGIYLSGENLFTWSPLYKYSKDVNVSNIGESDKDLTSSNSGDGYNYPMMKSFSIGLNVTF